MAPINSRGSRKWPKTRYRRQLKRRFPKIVYRERVHVEGAFSQDKRQLGSALRARSDDARAQELFLRDLVHDLYSAPSAPSFRSSQLTASGA